ncbi:MULTISPECIES: tryptophan synthase subunit alpha [unclassified Prochlorococcus]|uniref:tryptophan synthase subunit alpha n=1 Tax=unclassified Prochlorococcus TaxID=2627481 RepID=UPI0005338CBB|nr:MULTISPECIES: tryptophan synthase subunit alpha [unclassified Prochlorococcus]KGG15021.1 Tryptophan synthase alpha chain [Prochlorococcus sp. MIT 0602]KGG17141.1 Tryptophan synthase alpha chain [Prochlorococcus sp. MIT 0603]
MKNSAIAECFIQSKKQGRIALMPFIMAGDPDLNTSAQILLKLQEKGADIIELGIPYSDPLADGPIIQLAASRALSSGTSPKAVLEMLSNLKGRLNIPIILFTYSNPLLNYGMESFCELASNAGASGLVVPDLPLEEAKKLSLIAVKKGLDLVLLVAPTTPSDRMKKISESSSGFTYLVSVTGVTGERTVIEDRVKLLVNKLKKIHSNPVAVGFGISEPKHVSQVREWGADGAIIGSALVKRISKASKENAVEEAGKFCSELRKAAGY